MAPHLPTPLPRSRFEVLCDTSCSEDDRSLDESTTLSDSQYHALRHLPVGQIQNRRSSASSSSTIDSLTTELSELHIDTEGHELNRAKQSSNWAGKQKNQAGRRLKRPSIANNTFEVLETVPENESHGSPDSPAPGVSHDTQHYLDLPVGQSSQHPLSIAARNITSAEQQLAKHRDGQFEWVLSVRIATQSACDREIDTKEAPAKFKKVHFGCNLLPTQQQAEGDMSQKDGVYTLLVTPVEGDEEPVEVDIQPASDGDMALAEANGNSTTPSRTSEPPMAHEVGQITPASASCTGEHDSFAGFIPLRSPAKPAARIEDSVEALDKLEDQLEAFDEAAHFEQLLSPKEARPSTKNGGTVRFATPQPKRTASTKNRSASVRAKPVSEPRQPSLRKTASMVFQSGDKHIAQEPPKKSAAKGLASLLPPKQPTRSTKQPTVSTFELPGEAVARKLREKREARLSMQAAAEEAAKPTTSTLRRTRSARPPTRPTFELPGEAISRRKREEREAQLRAQEEEERKRREFKARPIRSSTVPSSVPRETLASRARQSKAGLSENAAQQTSTIRNKRPSVTAYSNSRPPLSNTNNQTQPRGRGLQTEGTATSPGRPTSSSTVGSGSNRHTAMSIEEVQQQKLRGQDIYQRDNSRTGDREREKREREALARLAREEAAERSRQQSREWAAKQARKRMTVGSLRDVMA